MKPFPIAVILYFGVASCSLLKAQDELVDLFSGDFRYSVPIVHIPSPDGQGISLTANYKSSISVNQKSSWIGLGWDLDIGEIRREVKGIPDDWKGKSQTIKKYKRQNTSSPWVSDETTTTSYYGALNFKHFDESNSQSELDVYSSSSSGNAFSFPDYDQFMVSAPGLKGVFQPILLDIGTLVKKNAPVNLTGGIPLYFDKPGNELSLQTEIDNYPGSPIPQGGSGLTCTEFSKTAEFRFLNEFGAINPTTNASTTNNTFETGTSLMAVNNEYKTIGSRHIVHYLNSTYVAAADGLIKYPGYNPSDYTLDDLAAFKITDENGYTYHFSLPVYMKGEKNINIEMENFDINNALKVTVIEKPTASSYAVSWKLTAITGADFIDTAPFGVINDSDLGYWVKFTYKKWSANFDWQMPYYDGTKNFGEVEEYIRQYRETYKNVPDNPTASQFGEFTDEVNISKGTTEVYYLETIETASHTAIFVKEVRLDEFSKRPPATSPTSPSAKVIPNLRLKRVILLNQADALTLSGNYTGAISNPVTSKFVSLGTPYHCINETRYQASKLSIDPKTLANIEFTYDYSLCQGYMSNINTPFNPNANSIPLTLPGESFSHFEKYVSPTVPSNSGKLTLLKISYGGIGNVINKTPSYDFKYSNNNPNYHPFKKDFWGFYKSDWTPALKSGEYQSCTSKNLVDAWNLTGVATPKGANLYITYESDEYSSTGRDNKPIRTYGGTISPAENLFTADDASFYNIMQNQEGCEGAVEKIILAYPGWCKWQADYYNQEGAPQTWVEARLESNKRRILSLSDFQFDVNDTEHRKILPVGAQNFDFDLYCGKGPTVGSGNLQATFENPNYNKARISVTLNKVYGGGVRVKELKIREKNANNEVQEYKTGYTYSNGAASIEPDRFTPPFFSNKPRLADLYDRHSLSPSVGYSKVKVAGFSIDANVTDGIDSDVNDNYALYEFYNYNDYPFSNRGISTFVSDATKSDSKNSFSDYFTCIDNLPNPTYQEYRCYNLDGTVGLYPSPTGYGCTEVTRESPPSASQINGCFLTHFPQGAPEFNIKYLKKTGKVLAKDRSHTFLGKLKTSAVYDKNNRLLNIKENEYSRVQSTSQVFHQRTHSLIPLHYDPTFFILSANAPNIENLQLGQFGAFNSPNSKAYATVLNSDVYYSKQIENEILKKEISVSNDIRSVSEYVSHDPLTGLPTKIVTKDPSTGEVLEKELEYAYTDEVLYPGMGAKAKNSSNYNLLKLVSTEKLKKGGALVTGKRRTYRKDIPTRSHNGTSFVTANQTKSWKPFKEFLFNGDSDPLNWREEIEFSLFNTKGDVLEQKKINATNTTDDDRYYSLKYGYSDKYIITKCSDSKYGECTYSGAEDGYTISTATFFGGEVKLNGTNSSVNSNMTYVHTGLKSILVNPNGIGFEYKIPVTEITLGRDYISRVWVYNNANNAAKLTYSIVNKTTGLPTALGSVVATPNVAGYNNQGYFYPSQGWSLLTLNIPIPNELNPVNFDLIIRAENASGSSVAYFDDFRFHPSSSSMTNYVYNTFTGLPEFVLNDNGFYTRLEYDPLGRANKMFEETIIGERMISEFNVNYYRLSNPNPFNF